MNHQTSETVKREILTVGHLRRAIENLHDDCHVEVNVGDVGFCDGISADAENDGPDCAWLSIVLDNIPERAR